MNFVAHTLIVLTSEDNRYEIESRENMSFKEFIIWGIKAIFK